MNRSMTIRSAGDQLESDNVQRAHYVANLTTADRLWREMPVDELIACYGAPRDDG
jgi:hypothetical protein